MRKGVSAGELRLAFAGDRDIAVWVLDFLLAQGVRPLALLLSDEDRASHAPALRRRFGRAYYGARIDGSLEGSHYGSDRGGGVL